MRSPDLEIYNAWRSDRDLEIYNGGPTAILSLGNCQCGDSGEYSSNPRVGIPRGDAPRGLEDSLILAAPAKMRERLGAKRIWVQF